VLKCRAHKTCMDGFVQGPEAMDILIKCLLNSGILVVENNRYVKPKPKKGRR